MGRYLFAILLFCNTVAMAQFRAVYIGVNGLTCSQCSRTVELRIRQLAFVADVQMNLQHTEGKILLKQDQKTDIEKIAQAVTDAGFSVRYLSADLDMGTPVSISGSCISYAGDGYSLMHAPASVLAGVVRLKFIGKKYLSPKEFKQQSRYMVSNCGAGAGKLYYVITEEHK